MKALYPYATFFGDVTLVVDEVRIDNEFVAGRVDVDGCTVDLHRIERADWETAEISLTVSAPPSEVADATEVQCIAVVNCN